MHLLFCGYGDVDAGSFLEITKHRSNACDTDEFPFPVYVQCHGLSATYLALYFFSLRFLMDDLVHGGRGK